MSVVNRVVVQPKIYLGSFPWQWTTLHCQKLWRRPELNKAGR